MKYMSLFVKSEEDEDDTTKNLKLKARQESKLLRSQDIERGEKDKVQHAINVELGIVEEENNDIGDGDDDSGHLGTGKKHKLSSLDDHDSSVEDLSSKQPKKRNKVGKKEKSMKSSSKRESDEPSSSASFDPFFVEESVNDEGIEVGVMHTNR